METIVDILLYRFKDLAGFDELKLFNIAIEKGNCKLELIKHYSIICEGLIKEVKKGTTIFEESYNVLEYVKSKPLFHYENFEKDLEI